MRIGIDLGGAKIEGIAAPHGSDTAALMATPGLAPGLAAGLAPGLAPAWFWLARSGNGL